uniref:Uncharacterized protein n=1 Tax=Molossus molossus TaxID=27622 RepID=A0A7J8J0Z9_MOLMO|nr:hypothetical protein HJG59_010379 [Molossus molossus]
MHSRKWYCCGARGHLRQDATDFPGSPPLPQGPVSPHSCASQSSSRAKVLWSITHSQTLQSQGPWLQDIWGLRGRMGAVGGRPGWPWIRAAYLPAPFTRKLCTGVKSTPKPSAAPHPINHAPWGGGVAETGTGRLWFEAQLVCSRVPSQAVSLDVTLLYTHVTQGGLKLAGQKDTEAAGFKLSPKGEAGTGLVNMKGTAFRQREPRVPTI